jgi:hypothetical protein
VIAPLFSTNPGGTDPGPGLLAPAVVAAVVAGCISLVTLWFNHRRDRLERQRELLADAFAACQAYKEFPFRVRRRAGGEKTVDERIRLNSALSDTQAKLNEYSARLRVEAPRVAGAYTALVAELKRIAGPEISRAWDTLPADDDAAMHVTDIDLSGLAGAEDCFLTAVEAHLSLARRARQRLPGMFSRRESKPPTPSALKWSTDGTAAPAASPTSSPDEASPPPG